MFSLFLGLAAISLQVDAAEKPHTWVIAQASLPLGLENAVHLSTLYLTNNTSGREQKPTNAPLGTAHDRLLCSDCTNLASVHNEEPRCKLYLAESTISNAGVGMYTAVDLHEESQVGYGDIVIPLVDIELHNGGVDDLFFLWYDYTWQANSLGRFFEREGDTDDLHGCVHGFGAAINCNFALNNVEANYPKYDSAGLNRGEDPGIGAFTAYHDRTSQVTKNVPAGAELFVSYGESWFTTREDELGEIPTLEDFEIVDDLLATYEHLVGMLGISNKSTAMREHMWKIISSNPYDGRAMKTLPKSFADVEHASEVSVEGLHRPGSIRSLEWLEANGKCVDNIRPGNSSIPQAGRGAFATRFIAKGGLVAPSPMIHIPDKSVLNMYDLTKDTSGKYVRDASSVIGQQLLVNYCFGHRNSTLLLSPYGPVVGLINHNKRAPNAEIRWADSASPNHNPEWLDLTVDELFTKYHSGLSFDYIATRNIYPGEEILVDYGAEWEEAWNRHVESWAPTQGNYVSALELNRDWSTPLRTRSEQLLDPYVGVELKCRTQRKGRKPGMEPCEIILREVVGGVTLYTAEFRSKTSGRSGGQTVLKRARRSAFVFFDRPRSSDMHLRNAFRHEMMINDDIFPTAWMNK